MSMSKKGFTLIELIASIVILGIIMMVAVVSVNQINAKAALSASIVSAKNYIRGIEYKNFYESNDDVKVYRVDNEVFSDVVDNGQIPEDGIVSVIGNKVLEANLCVEGSSLKYKNGIYTELDSDIFCYYKENALLANVGGTGIDPYSLNSETKVIGIPYKSPAYEEFLSLAAEEKTQTDFYSQRLIFDTFEVEKAKKMVSGLVAKTDNKVTVLKTNANILNVSNVSDKSYILYDLNSKERFAKIEEQGQSELCWAYAANDSAEMVAFKKGYDINFSETQFDYFSRDIPATDFKIEKNSYSAKLIADLPRTEKKGERGGINELVLKSYFTGLVAQTEELFGTNNKHTRENTNYAVDKTLNEVFNSKNVEYYVKQVEYIPNYFSTLSSYETIDDLSEKIASMKNTLVNSGAISVGVCGKTIREYSGAKLENYETGVLTTKISTYSIDCGKHELLIVGWDDNIVYTASNKTHKGAWIAKNSHGTDMETQPQLYKEQFPYVYIMYDYFEMYTNDMLNVVDVDVKTWDNSYDSYNNGIQIQNENFESAFYFEKIDGSEEQLTNLGLLSMTDNSLESDVYVLDVKDSNECSELKITDYQIVGDLINKSENSNLVAKGIYLKANLDSESFGYKIFDISTKYNFKNNFCVLSKKNYDAVSVFSKDVVKNDKENLEIIISNISGNTYVIDSQVKNIDSGETINYIIKDASGNDVTSKMKISNNYVINNVAHTKIIFPDEKRYTITATKKDVNSNQIIINDFYQNDVEPPKCRISSVPDKLTKQTKSMYVTCTDDNLLDTKTLKKSDLDVGFLKVSIQSITTTNHSGKSATWKVSIKKHPLALFGGNVTIKLKKGAVKDAAGNSNSQVSAGKSTRITNLFGK